jgi:hypothetical protein
MLRRINTSAALIALICFFLPWEQVSCGAARDTLSGWELARQHETLLFLVPLLMLAVIVAGALRRGGERQTPLAVLSIMAGGLSLYLINRERLRVNDESAVISAQLTGWLWLGLLSTLAVLSTGIGMLMKRRRDN